LDRRAGQRRRGRLVQFYAGLADELIIHVRHRAWLNAKVGKKGQRRSRLEAYTEDEAKGVERPELELPTVDGAEHLIAYLFEVGPSEGGEVLTFSEMAAWSALTGRELSAWEAQTLRALSAAYLAELQDAEHPARPPPGGIRIPAAPFAGAFEALAAMAIVEERTSPRDKAPASRLGSLA
jgi:hypothetical protein